jgi:hypothetical protein
MGADSPLNAPPDVLLVKHHHRKNGTCLSLRPHRLLQESGKRRFEVRPEFRSVSLYFATFLFSRHRLELASGLLPSGNASTIPRGFYE